MQSHAAQVDFSAFSQFLPRNAGGTRNVDSRTVGREQEGPRMDLMSLATDNITEILTRIVEFSQARQKVLIQNIIYMDHPEFVPKELEVHEFSNLVNDAIDEHVRSRRLVLRDTQNIKFAGDSGFEVTPVIDEQCRKLLAENLQQYIERQISKLWENSLNQKVAAEMLKQRQETVPLGV
jgi:flagellar basal body rod protein FlgB